MNRLHTTGEQGATAVWFLPLSLAQQTPPAAAALLALALGAAAALYAYATRHFGYWRRKGVPFLQPLPFVGNLKDVVLFRKHISSILRDTYTNMKGQRYIGMYYFDQPVLLVKDRSLIKSICNKNFDHFNERAFRASHNDPLNREAVFGRSGKEWKDLRVRISPAFSTGNLKKFFVLLEQKAKHLASYFDDAVYEGTARDVEEACGRYAMDAAVSVGFGLEGRALEDQHDPLHRLLHTIFVYSKFYLLAALALIARVPLVRALNLPLVPGPLADFLRRTVWDIVRQRQRAGAQAARGDFLDLLMKPRTTAKKAPDTDLKGDVLVAQAFAFISAGFEGSAYTMSFALYHLAKEEAVQEKLRTQLQLALREHGGKLTYEALQSVAYLDMVITETLRLYPILPVLDRVCTKSYSVEGSDLVIDEGTVVYGCTMGIHRDPDLYPRPDHFDPERFSEENKKSLPSDAYFPFGDGHRMCVGKRLGRLQTKMGLAHIILNYRLHPCAATPPKMEFDLHTFMLHPRHGVPLKFSHVNPSESTQETK